MNTHQQHGASTGQHTQPQQQAELPGCVEALEEMERAKPVTMFWADSTVGQVGTAAASASISAMFERAERIEMKRFTNLSPWQDAARDALARAAAEDSVFHCDECGAARGTCECAWKQTAAERAAEMDGDRRGNEDRS